MSGHQSVRKRDLYRAAAAAMHEMRCGTPPSCGKASPCADASIDDREVRAAVNAVTDRLQAGR